jgi:hypothetical protein
MISPNHSASSCVFKHPSRSPASVALDGPLLLNLRVPFFAGACFSLALALSAQVHNIPPPPLSTVAHHSTLLLDTGFLFSPAPQMDPTPPHAIRTILRPTKMSLLVELAELALKSTRELRTIHRFCLLIRRNLLQHCQMAAWVRSAKFSCKSAESSRHFTKPCRVQQKLGNGVFFQAFCRSEVMSALPLHPSASPQATE